MSVQLESIFGLIELRDEFTSQVNLATIATQTTLNYPLVDDRNHLDQLGDLFANVFRRGARLG